MNLPDKILPKQHIGSKTGATARYNAKTRHEAIAAFTEAKYRLLNINNWYELCGHKGAQFQLTDKSGNLLNKPAPETGDLIRIKLPAPQNEKGDGYDWVIIEKIEKEKDQGSDEELFGFRARPVPNPHEPSNKEAHFYKEDSTSTFLIYRKTSVVYAMERGRNEVPNVTGSFLNRLRNSVVALSAMFGFSKPQWKMLMKGILNKHN